MRVKNSTEALNKVKEHGPYWSQYKTIAEYLKVREAFEKDKNEAALNFWYDMHKGMLESFIKP